MTRPVEFADPKLQAGFTQIANVVLRDASLSAGARLTYAMLESFAWGSDECWAGQKTLGDLVGVGDRMIRKYLDELVAGGLLKVERQGLRKPNRYLLFGSGLDRNHSSALDRNSSSDEVDTDKEDSVDKPDRKQFRVNRKVVSDSEYALAVAVVSSFNEIAGTALRVDPHLTPIVGRIRERPELNGNHHRQIIEAVFAGDHWWKGAPGPRIIYGNAAQFEQSIELARAAAKKKAEPKFDVNAEARRIRKAQGLDS